MRIDTTFDFRSDSNGRDPDSYSPRLRAYHQYLWSKPLPSGKPMTLENDRPGSYLVFGHGPDVIYLASDTVIPAFHHKASAVVAELREGELEAFNTLGYTIGGMMLFPGNRINNKMTINGARGMHPSIADRFDLTVECIRRHYAGESSPLSEVLERYSDFFALFEDFSGYVDFWLLQDLADGGRVRFALPFDDFKSRAVPQNLMDYRTYMSNSIDFLNARNARIARYVGGLASTAE